jgi:hypothetical protein
LGVLRPELSEEIVSVDSADDELELEEDESLSDEPFYQLLNIFQGLTIFNLCRSVLKHRDTRFYVSHSLDSGKESMIIIY